MSPRIMAGVVLLMLAGQVVGQDQKRVLVALNPAEKLIQAKQAIERSVLPPRFLGDR